MDIISEGLVLGRKGLCPISRPGTGAVVDYRVSVELVLWAEVDCVVSIKLVLGL